VKPGDVVLCGPDRVRARVVRVSSAPRRSSDAELIPRPATIVVCEMPWGDHWSYWEEHLELIEPDPPGTDDATGGTRIGDVVRHSRIGDVVRHRATGLRGRIESVTLRSRQTARGAEEYRVLFVALEPGQHAVWRDGEIDA
jgi:hypothetical protein